MLAVSSLATRWRTNSARSSGDADEVALPVVPLFVEIELLLEFLLAQVPLQRWYGLFMTSAVTPGKKRLEGLCVSENRNRLSGDTERMGPPLDNNVQSYPQRPSCLWLRNCTSSVIITGNPGAQVRSNLGLAAGSQFNKWRSRNSDSARAREMAVLASHECSQV
jgi:hypothetical protein